MFYKMYQAVQPRLVTEFVYRHAPDKVATVFMSIERADELPIPISEEVDDVIKGLAARPRQGRRHHRRTSSRRRTRATSPARAPA